MTKRQRTDTAAGALNAMQGASMNIDPPAWCHVPEAAMPFWRSITRARSADRWNESDLEVAAELARLKANIERINIELEQEGDIIINEKGTPIPNPKHRLLETMTSRMATLSRMLHVHAEATQGKSRDQVKGNKKQQEAGQALGSVADDDLIARPNH